MEHEEQKDPVAQSTSVHLTTSAADFSKETLVVKEEETYDAALLPSARYERRVGVSLVRAAWERRPEGPAYLLSSVTLLYLAGLCAF